MSSNKCAISFYMLTLWIVLISLFCGSQAALRTEYVEESCFRSNSISLDLRARKTGILASVPFEPLECSIQLTPERGYQVVIAFYRYNLGPEDSLVFRDKSNFQLSLKGEGIFLDERKSLTFDGPLTIYYFANRTYGPDKFKFQFVYTQVRDSPCYSTEYQCRNNKCIPKYLTCDGHNHCGDMSSQDDCRVRDDAENFKVTVTKTSNVWMISIIVCSVILGIVIIAFTAVLIRGCVLKSKKAKDSQSQLPTVAATPEAQQVQPTAPPSIFNRVRQSFRSLRRHQATAPPAPTAAAPEQTSENYEVPSMYPHLPSAPNYAGVDNPDFKVEE